MLPGIVLEHIERLKDCLLNINIFERDEIGPEESAKKNKELVSVFHCADLSFLRLPFTEANLLPSDIVLDHCGDASEKVNYAWNFQ